MKASLTAFIVLVTVLVAMGPWASGQILLDGGPWEGRFRDDTTLIDDVDPASQQRAPTRQLQPPLGDPRQPHPALKDIRGRHRLILIDDVDREAQRRAAEERAARQRAVGQLDSGPVGRYAVAASDKCTVLVDTMTGQTWMLSSSATARPSDAVWLPIKRIDDEDRASQWRAYQEELRSKQDAQDERQTP
ncbi:MAG: hypothetical protein ABIP48_16010 [Planctomycetota bacterium]